MVFPSHAFVDIFSWVIHSYKSRWAIWAMRKNPGVYEIIRDYTPEDYSWRFVSDHFPFQMGDGCRFQPLIFQGVFEDTLIEYTLDIQESLAPTEREDCCERKPSNPKRPWDGLNSGFIDISSKGVTGCLGYEFTPWKINMEPANQPFEKKQIFQTSMIMFHVNLQGCSWWFQTVVVVFPICGERIQFDELGFLRLVESTN